MHVAIIMDGNRRWAKSLGKPSLFGHTEGAKTLRKIVESCPKFGIDCLTVFAFSTENWKRSYEEVGGLMNLFETYLRKETKEMAKEGIKFRVIGNRLDLSEKLQNLVRKAEEETKDNSKLIFQVAISYGGRDEITRAVKKISEDIKSGTVSVECINQSLISSYLDTSGVSDPDLIIRTSGEQRVSGFLLWQMEYSELYFSAKHWPEFDEGELEKAVNDFSKRSRRFGNVA
ncbi:polyprenyl diphosphate synthase [Candidatus Hydrogenosomobacter endosymbioticus]|uniref:Isoprenyl transferase n=1 Tax=Candidatus Hydrogenosomobacter endosymbioticus TaxID=2558174 RepID=A0ABN6L3D0_9PROT|nr:polyprenyl diphosphate synthase [Candidatus Hydrogenosomobacter endosymbioticus]BDB96389.1 isoprenyl transferase [Candidatus Hydrogenosomobacter endosymbioticus]